MTGLLKFLFFLIVIRPLVLMFLGLNVRHGEHLPQEGPAIIIANHNSHLDTMVLMSLFPFGLLAGLRPVAAADYFLRTPFLAWFALKIIGIIPLERKASTGSGDIFAELTRICDFNYNIYILDKTIEELESIQKRQTGLDKKLQIWQLSF